MRLRNFLGVVGALFFAAFSIYAASEGAWRQSFEVVSLWIACAYWRCGEGLDDSYNKQQSFIAGGLYGLMGLIIQRLDDLVLPELDSTVLFLYMSAAGLLLLRLTQYVYKNGALVISDPSTKGILRFIFFQQPEQIRKHTRG